MIIMLICKWFRILE